jgi:hypothetical protein
MTNSSARLPCLLDATQVTPTKLNVTIPLAD